MQYLFKTNGLQYGAMRFECLFKQTESKKIFKTTLGYCFATSGSTKTPKGQVKTPSGKATECSGKFATPVGSIFAPSGSLKTQGGSLSAGNGSLKNSFIVFSAGFGKLTVFCPENALKNNKDEMHF